MPTTSDSPEPQDNPGVKATGAQKKAGAQRKSTRKPPTDYTGRQAERLAEEAAKKQQEAAAKMAMVTAIEAEEDDRVIDLSQGPNTPQPEPVDVATIVVEDPDEIIDLTQGPNGPPVVAAPPTIIVDGPAEIIPLDDIVNLTYGVDPETRAARVYNLKKGRTYWVPADFAAHCREKELVY